MAGLRQIGLRRRLAKRGFSESLTQPANKAAVITERLSARAAE